MNAPAPIFLGKSGILTPLPGSTMQKNAYGIDVLTRQFSCPRSKVSTAIPAKSSADVFYPNLRATGNYSVTEGEGLLCTLTVEYKGLLGGFLPDPLISTSLSTGQTSATSGDTGSADDQRTWEIVYYSPTQTFRYITNGKPSGPKFATYKGGPVAGATIQTQSITDGNGRRRAGASRISKSDVAELASMNSTPVPGTPYYEVEEVWRGVIKLQ